MLDFLDLAKNFWFPDQKPYSTPPEFPDGNDLGLTLMVHSVSLF